MCIRVGTMHKDFLFAEDTSLFMTDGFHTQYEKFLTACLKLSLAVN